VRGSDSSGVSRVSDLPTRWRAIADQLRPYAPPAAEAWSRAADELGEALRAAEEELLTPAQAVTESGYSERRLRELRAEGRLVDHGTPGRPRYRRGELPRRARSSSGCLAGWSVEEHVERIVADHGSRATAP
jgi:hypothetical protein